MAVFSSMNIKSQTFQHSFMCLYVYKTFLVRAIIEKLNMKLPIHHEWKKHICFVCCYIRQNADG